VTASNADPSARDFDAKFRTVTLERLRIAAQATLSRQVLADAQFDLVRYTGDQLIAKLESYVLAQHLADTTETTKVWVPRSWWDHWKVDHPRLCGVLGHLPWFHPTPRYTAHRLTVTWHEYNAFPHNTIAFPKGLGSPVLWRTSDREVT